MKKGWLNILNEGSDRHQCNPALELDWSDFEDAVQYVVGESLALDYIITRNVRDFAKGKIPAVTPEQFIEIITDTV